jgi:hypothetical protein
MIAVIFEAQPHPDRKSAYLDAAESLRPLLAQIDGFVSIERFESLVHLQIPSLRIGATRKRSAVAQRCTPFSMRRQSIFAATGPRRSGDPRLRYG